MQPTTIWLLLFLGLASFQQCTSQTFPLSGSIVVPDGQQHSLASTRVLLHLNNGAERIAFPKRDGSFVLHSVPVGTHLLTVDSPTLLFQLLRVDMSARRNGLPTVSLADDNSIKLPEPLTIYAAAVAQYFDERQPFNMLAFFKSPMGLMLAFTVVAMVILPKLKLDPEELRQYQEAQQRRQEDQQAAEARRR